MLSRDFIVFAAVSLIVASCASTPSTPERIPRLADDVRSSIGTVGVITAGHTVGGELDGPVGVGKQIATGVAGGGAVGAVAGAGTGALIGLACGPGAVLCVPVGAVIGGVFGFVFGGATGGFIGGSNAISAGTAADLNLALARAIADHELQTDLRQRVLQHIGSATKGINLGAAATVSAETPDYSSFRDSGVDAVLEMSLTQVGFTSKGGDDPAVTLIITARARLIGVPDESVLWNVEQVVYESPKASASLWTAGASGLLQSEIGNGLEAVASQIGEALFVATGP